MKLDLLGLFCSKECLLAYFDPRPFSDYIFEQIEFNYAEYRFLLEIN